MNKNGRAVRIELPGVKHAMMPILEVDGQPYVVQVGQMPSAIVGAAPRTMIRVALMGPVAVIDAGAPVVNDPGISNCSTPKPGMQLPAQWLAAAVEMARKLAEQVRRQERAQPKQGQPQG